MRVHLWQDSLLAWAVLWISLWYSTGSQQKAADTCSDKWVGVPKNQPKTWYKISCKAANWLVAETDCQKLGGHLAEIGSREEQTFLYDALRAVNVTELWLGYRIKAYITNGFVNYVNCVVRSQTASKLWTGVLFKKNECLAARRSTCGLIRQDSVGTVWDQACNDAHPYMCETQKAPPATTVPPTTIKPAVATAVKPKDSCEVGGKFYKARETWDVDCKRTCWCLRPSINFYYCEAKCTDWTGAGIPPGCKLEPPKSGECCEGLNCSHITAPP